MSEEFYATAEKFVSWIESRVIQDARGDRESIRRGKPADRYWLGRLATETEARKIAATERILRLDPCSVGFTFCPSAPPPWNWQVSFRCRTWAPQGKKDDRQWYKSKPLVVELDVAVETAAAGAHGSAVIKSAFEAASDDHHAARIEIEVDSADGRRVVTLTVVNESAEMSGRDANFYEVELAANVGDIEPFVLDALPDSFRYNRQVAAYGVNGGVLYENGTLRTADFVDADRNRLTFWDLSLGQSPDVDFSALADDPVTHLKDLFEMLERWVEREWSTGHLKERARAGQWSQGMLAEAAAEAEKARGEAERCKAGLRLLSNPTVFRAFCLMNRAFVRSGQGKYSSWRPFQLGFLLSALPGIVGDDDDQRMDVGTLWFATGGGKTETYLAAVVFGALYDRLVGKRSGLTAWSRFPLRMLSLQQTQRFADALAAAELVRREERIEGDPISLGYFVGAEGTPNRIRHDPREGEADADDPTMPDRYRVLLYCPFCRSDSLQLAFDEATWCLQHRCTNGSCPWPDASLPFYVVDEEIYRFLPTVVVGTLDKAASIAIQAAMRGFYAAPLGLCTGSSHGFTYATRSSSPNGCLVPGCTYARQGLNQSDVLFPPRLRIQDELHLLKDSLGAIDSHYETLLDHLTKSAGSKAPKIIASSATLMGYEAQVRTLYHREGSVFPLPGPKDGHSFWAQTTERPMRRYVALAPRGQTQEFANDRIAESVQHALREFLERPEELAHEAGVDVADVPRLIDIYGVHVIYGSKLRDVEGTARSLESQPPVDDAPLNVAMLVGGTPLATVLRTLKRLQSPERDFNDRIHIVCASAMMSHGVDVDRLNIMTMIGMPLSTAEFIQTSARIGRRFPGLVLVLHRMAVERDARIFRSFRVYVHHGDRLIEPIAITRNSRRVLERTAPGVFMSDVLGLYEPRWLSRGNKPLTTPREMRKFVHGQADFQAEEAGSMSDALQIPLDAETPMALQLEAYVDELMANINDPASSAKFTSQLPPGKVLISLRDVEERIPIRESVN